MVFHPVPNTVEVKLKGDHAGDPRITVLHYRYGPVGGPRPTTAELNSLLAGVIANPLSRLQAMVAGGTRWTEVTAQDIHDQFGAFVPRPLNPVIVASQLGDVLPGNVNLVLAKKTSSALRRGKGRMFVMDLPESGQNDALITNTMQALAIDLAASLLAPQGIIRSFVPVVASKTFGSFAPILSIIFDIGLDSLYTRLRGKRRHKRTP